MGTGPGQKLPQSYIKSTNKGAQIDSSLLVTNRERDLANGVRSVRSQASIKANATMVCSAISFTIQFIHMRKIIQKIS